MLTPREEIQNARLRIKDYLTPTPLIRSDHFSERTGADVFLKLEILNPTNSFKPRGAFNAILALPEQKRRNGVIAASAGNHGLAVSYAASRLRIPVDIFLPTYALQTFVDSIGRLGARVTLHGDSWDEANHHAMTVAAESNRPYIHPFDNPHVVAGQATIGLEIFEAVDSVDTLITSIGGGGLIAGLISAVQFDSPNTKIWGVETQGVDSMAQSLKNGERVTLTRLNSIAKSLGAKMVGERMYELTKRYVEDVIVTTDAAAVDTIFETLDHEKLLLEPATACCLAALTSGDIPVSSTQTIVVVICGGNITLQDALNWRSEFSSSG